MRQLLVLLVMAAAVVGLAACGDSGPSGPDAKAVEEFEELGLSQEEAEAEVHAADREAAKQTRRDDARIQREIHEEERPAERKPKETPAQAAGFNGKYEEAYELAIFACGNFPLERIAKEFHLSPSAGELEVAEAYADGYYGQFEQAAFEGCIEGIRKG